MLCVPRHKKCLDHLTLPDSCFGALLLMLMLMLILS